MSYAGWDFLDAQWDALYPGDPGTLIFGLPTPRLDPHPCKRVIAWPADGHWHLVAYGLTELFEKVSPHADQDGWGFELTMRVPRDASSAPPRWAVGLLRRLVAHVHESGRGFGEGHYMPLPGAFGPAANLTGVTFVRDPSFEVQVGPYGRFELRQVIGLTADELDATIAAEDGRVIAALGAVDRWLMTDPYRASVFDGPHAPARPGPPTPLQRSVPYLAVAVLRLTRSLGGDRELHVGADDAHAIAEQLLVRLPAGRAFDLIGDNAAVRFRRADTTTVVFDERVEVTLAPAALGALVGALRAGAGRAIALPELDELRVRVVER